MTAPILKGSEQRHALVMTAVGKRWRTGGPDNWVLREVSLHVPAGTIAWVGGRNGAGKTTLLRMASGVLARDCGSLTFRRLDPERQRREYQRRTGLLSAGDRALYARLTVRAHLRFWARVSFVPRSARRACVDRAIAEFGLGELADRRVDRMSLGQRQRLRLAIALMHDPDLVLLDEPANSLDDDGLELLRLAALGVAERGGVVLWCSPPSERHTLPSNLAVVLEDGRAVPA